MTDRDQAGADEGGLVGHAAGPSSASASSSPTSLFRQSLAMDALVPPLRFTLLSLSFRDLSPERVASTTPLPRVYSSSHPLPRHLPFLSRLQLKTVVALTPKDPLKQVPAIGTWAEAQGVEVKWVKIGAWKDVGTAAISREVAEETISTLISTASQPALLVTLTPQPASMILALLRLVQGYSLPSIHSELHRSLRAGLEGDADEDDREDCENWAKSWIGKECHLALRASQVEEWVWPDGIMLSALRHGGGGSSGGGASSTSIQRQQSSASSSSSSSSSSSMADPIPHHHSTRYGSLNAQASHSSQPLHRSATLAGPSDHGQSSSPSSSRVTHPFLKLVFQPEQDEGRQSDNEADADVAGSASALTTTTMTTTPAASTTSPPSSTPAPPPTAPIRIGRKRSQTISEGRDDALSHLMAETAATAAIQSCGIDIGHGGGPHSMLSLLNTSDVGGDFSDFQMSKSMPVGARPSGPSTPTTAAAAQRPQPIVPTPPPVYDWRNENDDEDDEDAEADQSTPKAQARSSYLSDAQAQANTNNQRIRANSSSASAADFASASAYQLFANRLADVEDGGGGSSADKTPTKASLQTQQPHERQLPTIPAQGGDGDDGDDDDDDDRTADGSFGQAHARGRSRGDSNVTLRVPPLIPSGAGGDGDGEGDVDEDKNEGAVQSEVFDEPEEIDDDDDDDGDEEEEEEEEEEGEREGEGEEDFSARLEALDLA